jgi:hypothetical protein
VSQLLNELNAHSSSAQAAADGHAVRTLPLCAHDTSFGFVQPSSRCRGSSLRVHRCALLLPPSAPHFWTRCSARFVFTQQAQVDEARLLFQRSSRASACGSHAHADDSQATSKLQETPDEASPQTMEW